MGFICCDNDTFLVCDPGPEGNLFFFIQEAHPSEQIELKDQCMCVVNKLL